MATKKQQRRKYQRAREHARREVGDEPRPEKAKPDGAVVTKGGRTVQPASMQRAARRAVIFAALFFALLTFVPFGGGVSTGDALFQSTMIFVWATAITYFVDNYLYKRALRRD